MINYLSAGEDLAWSEDRRAAIPGVTYEPEEFGKVAAASKASVVSAAKLVEDGTIYDLDSGRWPGLPLFPGHPPFQIMTYRTAHGQDVIGDLDDWRGPNEVHMGFTTEVISGTIHTGTHLDALCHTTCGQDNHWWNGFESDRHLADFGPRKAEASSIAPIVTRGVLVDVTALCDGKPLPAGHVISLEEFKQVLVAKGIEIRPGDSVLVNTGFLTVWTDPDEVVAAHAGAGISIEIADYLIEQKVALVGADQGTVEADPSPDPVNPHPVHIRLMIENGIHLLENVHLADLARDDVREFMFVCLPLRIRGATGSMVRPIAIV